jgi:hypothetical protein
MLPVGTYVDVERIIREERAIPICPHFKAEFPHEWAEGHPDRLRGPYRRSRRSFCWQ